MRYFRLNLLDAHRAKYEVWERQNEAHTKPTLFHVSAEGLDASIWTEDANGEALLHLALDFLHLSYEVGDKQQVHAQGFGVG